MEYVTTRDVELTDDEMRRLFEHADGPSDGLRDRLGLSVERPWLLSSVSE